MRAVCSEYQRFLRAYERAFIVWVEPKNLRTNGALDAGLDKLEKKYQSLADHQRSCAACLDALGKEPIIGVKQSLLT
jgi:hypothetical protein